jgi:hypothetical protein
VTRLQALRMLAVEQLGAAPWAERARTELRACGQTIRRRDDARTDELTPRRRWPGSSRTVCPTPTSLPGCSCPAGPSISILCNVFTKLGISSRTELVRLMLDPAHH